MRRSPQTRWWCRARPALAVAMLTVAVPAGPIRLAAAPQIVQPGAPGQSTKTISTEDAVAHARTPPSAAEIRFMQGMIGHHAQALDMTALAPSRTRSEAFLLMAARIETSQRDEIASMQQWLRAHGADVPDVHAHHAAGAMLMPGMLTPDEMRQLAEAAGPAFERLFLQFMIKHHTGALTMVRDLLAQPDGGSSPDVFAFATDIDADQRMDIERMRAMLARP